MNMKNKKINAVHVWKQLEDLVVPRLHLSVFDRAVYSHLLRHSRLEGKLQFRFSILWLARGASLSAWAARKAVRRLVAKGALRLAERSRAGHVVAVRLPEEIRSLGAGIVAARAAKRLRSVGRLPGVGRLVSVNDLEKVDFLETRAPRQAIHAREGGYCFYCLRRLTPMVRCIDHVVARVRGGRNGYRNLVSSCAECNSRKGERRAEDFLRWLWREGRLSAGELSGRLRALAKLAAGKLRPALRRSARSAQPALPSQGDEGKGRSDR
jgi:5-methylcytosine-specific restriction endonuclease McrA